MWPIWPISVHSITFSTPNHLSPTKFRIPIFRDTARLRYDGSLALFVDINVGEELKKWSGVEVEHSGLIGGGRRRYSISLGLSMRTVPSSLHGSLSGCLASGSCGHGGGNGCKLVVAMAKRKKPSSSPSQSDPTPARITSNVKQNLQFLRLWKEFQTRKSGNPRPSTSYRRKRVEKEELPEDVNLYEDPTMALYYTHQGLETATPVLLVDGYNVCGYWMKLKKHFVSGRLDIARQKLIDELVTFSMLREVKVVVVFDAMMSGLPTHKETFAGIDVVFAGESCADSWIEKEVVALREDGCPKVWVVTSDHSQQHAAYGAGAFIWSSKALVSEIKASQKEVERMLQEHRSSSFQGKLLRDNLDSEVVDALKDLRSKLSENEQKSRR
ncbi:uncharacterized protein LOC116204752 isoform X2 [Punica granatum]|uniref:Uncharacterized protein LOC116204752 isoform X2 n=1 Tax=Punica granatum TaxID=22663 RepID=A0A6P8DEH4_PUNGR|nr:uncharacterized protein LOC116204752 isoform X2 [Punica granatum]